MQRPALVRLAQLGLAVVVAVVAFVATTRIGPALGGSISLHPLAQAPQPFLPDDTAGGRPGDWREVQWNFAGRYGVAFAYCTVLTALVLAGFGIIRLLAGRTATLHRVSGRYER